ncbi:MAG: methyltransferase domain-containing protein [Candidatus Nanoarchaeia archaeon]|jgi:hypothetical protein
MNIFKDTEETENLIAKAMILLKQGVHKSRVIAMPVPEEICEIAEARLRNEKIMKTSHQGLYFNLNDLRFATNEKAANYRAKRLKCNTIIEIGSGIGLQSIAFAKECKKVVAIEVDKRKHEYAKQNAKILGIKNIEFINDDALKIKTIPKADIVFCETEREAEEKERKIENIKPDIKKLLKKYEKTTKDVCIELPPQIKEIPFDCEIEYLSVNHELNRLNLYFGGLKKCKLSAVIAETGERLEGDGKKQLEENKPLKFIHEADKAVEKAGLTGELKADVFKWGEFLTSEKIIKSPFIKDSFEILKKCRNKMEAINALNKANCGKVILRYKIDPDKYWQERKAYEEKLEGEETLYLFAFGKELLACKKIP